MRAAAVLALVGVALAACSPGAPKGVDKAKLDEAVSDAIGDPASCLMIAERGSGRIVYRYNTATVCDRALPSCEGAGVRKVKDLAELVARDGQPRTLSCNTTADASRGVSWAAGPLPAKGLAYAAMMEGTRTFPGRMMAERLEPRLHDLGL
jgi:type II secretory pathway pseudopilin PulG